MSTKIILQARMGSARLPGKSLLPLSGTPLVLHSVKRAQASNYEVILAIPNTSDNDILYELVKDKVETYRGDPNDVLCRYIGASKGADVICRVTCDNPLPCTEEMVRQIKEIGDADYIYTFGYPAGVTVETFTRDALLRAGEVTISGREHVTIEMYNNPNFKTKWLMCPDWAYHPELSFTIDTQKDYDKLCKIFNKFGPDCTLEEIIKCERCERGN